MDIYRLSFNVSVSPVWHRDEETKIPLNLHCQQFKMNSIEMIQIEHYGIFVVKILSLS